MGLTTVLFLVFLVLKLCGVIAWPWLYVFTPLIFDVVLVVVFAFVFAVKASRFPQRRWR